jgi:hypothetical protein
MATASDNTAVAAGATVSNVAIGKKGFEYPTMTARAWRMKANAGVTGLLATCWVGDRAVFTDRMLPFGGAAAATPNYPSWQDQEIDRGVILPGENIRLDFRNPTAGAINVAWEIQVYP